MGIAGHNIGKSEAALGKEPKRCAAFAAALSVPSRIGESATRPANKLFPPLRMAKAGGRHVAVIGVIFAGLIVIGWRSHLMPSFAAAVLNADRGRSGRYDVAVVLALPAGRRGRMSLARAAGGRFRNRRPDATKQSPRGKIGRRCGLPPPRIKANSSCGFDRCPAKRTTVEWKAGQIVEMDSARFADDARTQIGERRRFEQRIGSAGFRARRIHRLRSGGKRSRPADYKIVGVESCRACHADDRAGRGAKRAHAAALANARRSSSAVRFVLPAMSHDRLRAARRI